jgi:hypothetical protein
MNPWVWIGGGAGVVLLVSLFMRLGSKRDWGDAFNFRGQPGNWMPPEIPKDEWQKWGKN